MRIGLGQVADISHAPSSELAACARAGDHEQLARAAKVAIEADRNEAAREAGYRVGLFQILHVCPALLLLPWGLAVLASQLLRCCM
jgi:hypothetical protein